MLERVIRVGARELSEAGAYQRHELYGETTMEVSNPQCMGQQTAVTLS